MSASDGTSRLSQKIKYSRDERSRSRMPGEQSYARPAVFNSLSRSLHKFCANNNSPESERAFSAGRKRENLYRRERNIPDTGWPILYLGHCSFGNIRTRARPPFSRFVSQRGLLIFATKLAIEYLLSSTTEFESYLIKRDLKDQRTSFLS